VQQLRQATSAGGAKTKSTVTEYKHLDGSFLSLVGALEVIWAVLTALVEDEAEVDGQVELDAEHVGLDGSAQADGGVEVDEPAQQRAARLLVGQANLDKAQHVGAHVELERVDGAPAEAAGRRGHHRRRGDDRAVAAVGCATLRRCEEEEAESKEESELGHCYSSGGAEQNSSDLVPLFCSCASAGMVLSGVWASYL
jgi:hypothetical protein